MTISDEGFDALFARDRRPTTDPAPKQSPTMRLFKRPPSESRIDSLADLPGEVVALLRLPLPVQDVAALSKALRQAYGKHLVIRTDITVDEWVPIAWPTTKAQNS